MVEDPADYGWSSYQCNGLGKKSELLTPHSLYLAIGQNEQDRQSSYRELFKYHVEGKLLEDIRKATNKGLALGNERFIADVQAITGKRLTVGKRGRKVGWRKAKQDE
mgnify:FL=1